MAANAVTRTEDRTSGNGRALASVVVGLAATATMPLAIVATRYSGSYELLHAGVAIPVAVLLGALAIGIARGALRLDDMRLGRCTLTPAGRSAMGDAQGVPAEDAAQATGLAAGDRDHGGRGLQVDARRPAKTARTVGPGLRTPCPAG